MKVAITAAITKAFIAFRVTGTSFSGVSSRLKTLSCFETRPRRSSARALSALSYKDLPLTLRRRKAPSRRVHTFFNRLLPPIVLVALESVTEFDEIALIALVRIVGGFAVPVVLKL